MRTLAVIVLAVFSACTFAQGFKPIAPEDIYIWQPCASACSATKPPTTLNPLCQSFGLNERGGWRRLIEGRIFDQYSRGYRKFVFHLPWGNDYDGGPMPWDAIDDLAKHQMGWVYTDWLEAMNIATRIMPEATFVHYIGSAKDLDTAGLESSRRYAEHSTSMLRNTAPLLSNPAIGIAFDHSATYEPGTHAWNWVRLLAGYKESQGQPSFMEAYARPGVEPVLKNAMVIETYHNFDQAARNSESYRWMKAAGGVVVRAGIANENEEPDEIGWAADVVRSGDIPAIQAWNPNSVFHTLTASQAADRINAIASYEGPEILLCVVGTPGVDLYEQEIYRKLRSWGYPIAPGVSCIQINAGTSLDPNALAASDPDFVTTVFRSRVEGAARLYNRRLYAFVDYEGWNYNGWDEPFDQLEAFTFASMLSEVKRVGYRAAAWAVPGTGRTYPSVDASSMESWRRVAAITEPDWLCLSGYTSRGLVSSGQLDGGAFAARLISVVRESRLAFPNAEIMLAYQAWDRPIVNGQTTMVPYTPRDAYEWARAASLADPDYIVWWFHATDSSSPRGLLDAQLRQAEILAPEFVRGLAEHSVP